MIHADGIKMEKMRKGDVLKLKKRHNFEGFIINDRGVLY